MKAWQMGHQIEELKRIEVEFNSFNLYCASPFSDMNKSVIAKALNLNQLVRLTDADETVGWIETSIVKTSMPIKMYLDVQIARKQKGDRVVSKFSFLPGREASVVEELKNYRENAWLFLWEEDFKAKRIAELAGFQKVGIKVSSFGEITGVYYKSGLDSAPPEITELPYWEKIGFSRLTLDEPMVKELTSNILSTLLRINPYFETHYSNYNQSYAWSALSLRGYLPDPHFITKPSEMSKKWQKEMSGVTFNLQNTKFRKDFPEVDELIKMLNGGKVHRIRFMSLAENDGELQRHTDLVDKDTGIADGRLARIHFPLVTNKDVVFTNWDWDGNELEYRMACGEAWYLDTRKPHRAINGGTEERIHLVIDIESKKGLRDLLCPLN